MNWTAYKVTVKETPRARMISSWIRFGESADQVERQTIRDARPHMREITILAVEPIADPRRQKPLGLANDADGAPRFAGKADPYFTAHTPRRRPMAKCDALSPAEQLRPTGCDDCSGQLPGGQCNRVICPIGRRPPGRR